MADPAGNVLMLRRRYERLRRRGALALRGVGERPPVA